VSGLDLGPLAAYAVAKGYIPSAAWYLIDVEHGFEIWNGGARLADNSFTVCTPAGCSAGPGE
jgi:cellulose 1,4-beta-cellobiosidase